MKINGFTLIELLISIAILTIVAVITLPYFSDSIGKNELQTTSWEIVDVLRRARSQAINGEQNSDWSVHFESDRFTIFRTATYNPVDPDNVEVIIPGILTISSISLTGGGDDVVFTKIRGTTTTDGTITVQDTNSGDTQVITISPAGRVN